MQIYNFIQKILFLLFSFLSSQFLTQSEIFCPPHFSSHYVCVSENSFHSIFHSHSKNFLFGSKLPVANSKSQSQSVFVTSLHSVFPCSIFWTLVFFLSQFFSENPKLTHSKFQKKVPSHWKMFRRIFTNFSNFSSTFLLPRSIRFGLIFSSKN